MAVLKCEDEGIINISLCIPKGKRQSSDLVRAEDLETKGQKMVLVQGFKQGAGLIAAQCSALLSSTPQPHLTPFSPNSDPLFTCNRHVNEIICS